MRFHFYNKPWHEIRNMNSLFFQLVQILLYFLGSFYISVMRVYEDFLLLFVVASLTLLLNINQKLHRLLNGDFKSSSNLS